MQFEKILSDVRGAFQDQAPQAFIPGKTVVIAPNFLNAKFNNFENENEPLKHWKFVNVN